MSYVFTTCSSNKFEGAQFTCSPQPPSCNPLPGSADGGEGPKDIHNANQQRAGSDKNNHGNENERTQNTKKRLEENSHV
jgi:hypothetical protein